MKLNQNSFKTVLSQFLFVVRTVEQMAPHVVWKYVIIFSTAIHLTQLF